MNRLLLVAAVATGAAVSPTASADPADPDPHMPNLAADYCPGGGGDDQVAFSYCDGVSYPDGSYWHATQRSLPLVNFPAMHLFTPGLACVVGDGGPSPAPAPPGGCNGEI